MTNQVEVLPTNPKRIKTFATFFKNYMSLSSIVVAALPIPVTSFSLIPTFKEQTKYFSVYTSLFCFLLLAYVFYSRHTLARLMFRQSLEIVGKPTKRISSFCVNSLPPMFIVLSLICVYGYHGILSSEINKIRPRLIYKHFNHLEGAPSNYKNACEKIISKNSDYYRCVQTKSYETLHDVYASSNASSNAIFETATYEWLCANCGIYSSKDVLDFAEADMLGPYDTFFMILSYLGIFLFAEAAFILMAIKEYLQEVLGLEDITLIKCKAEALPYKSV